MKTVVILITLLFYISDLRAQEVVFEQALPAARRWSKQAENLPVIDPATGLTTLFLVDKQEISALIIQDSISARFITKRPMDNSSELLGYSITADKHHLFFSNNAHTAFSTATLDYSRKLFSEAKSEIILKKERYITSASHNNKFYVLTVGKGTSILNLHIFEEANVHTVKSFSFEGKRFLKGSEISTIDDALEKYDQGAVYVDNRLPNPIEITGKRNKVYFAGEKLFLTFDNIPQFTILITIDLKTFQQSIVFHNIVNVPCAHATYLQGTSYIHEGRLYQLSVCPSAMAFSIQDLATSTVLARHNFTEDQEITIKNTEFKQEGSRSPYGPSERELDKTKQFLRKTAKTFPGISVYRATEGLQVTLGGYDEINTGAPGMGGAGGVGMTVGPANMPVSVMMPTYNPVYSSFVNNQASVSIYFKTILDPETLSHKSGKPGENPYEKIGDFIDSLGEGYDKKEPVAQTVYRKDNAFLLAYFDRNTGKLVVRSFAE